MGNDEQQIDVIHWRGHEIPVKAASRDGKAVGFAFMKIADMPPEFREAFGRWVRDVRGMGYATPSGEFIYMDDIEQFLAWEQAQAKLAGEDEE